MNAARHRALWDSGMLLAAVRGPDGALVDANDAALAVLGYTRDELGQGPIAWTSIVTEASGDGATPSERELVRKDGTRVPVLAQPVHIEGGEKVLVAIDLTERKRAEKELSASQARFARIAQVGIIGISFADLLGNVQDGNDAYLGIIGYTREDLAAGRVSWASLLPPEARREGERAAEQLMRTGVTSPWESEIIRKDGTRVSVLMGVALTDAPNTIAFIADLTDRKRAEKALRATEDQLRQAQKMEAVGRLAGGVAHDFNNVLSVIASCAELLAESVPAELRADTEEIRIAAGRAASLTRQLLMFSRQQVIEPKVIALDEIVRGTQSMLDRTLGEDVRLAIVAGAKGHVLIDRGSFEQVLMNLAVNARDAMPTGGQLTFETSDVVLDDDFVSAHVGAKTGPHVMLAVSDTGLGMDRATQARIFEPFFTTKEVGKGTGLGLSSVFGVIEQGGGTIWVYSEPGVGTTFRIYLPRVDAASVSPTPDPAPKMLGGSETVLIVEDDTQVRQVVCNMMRRLGYRVLEASDGRMALELAAADAGPIHLLLTDVVMPQMSGPELARRIALTRPDTKVLCVSGYADDSIVRHGVLDARVAYLQKPLTPNRLGPKVREVLES